MLPLRFLLWCLSAFFIDNFRGYLELKLRRSYKLMLTRTRSQPIISALFGDPSIKIVSWYWVVASRWKPAQGLRLSFRLWTTQSNWTVQNSDSKLSHQDILWIWFKIDLWDLLFTCGKTCVNNFSWALWWAYGGFCYGFIETSDLTPSSFDPLFKFASIYNPTPN